MSGGGWSEGASAPTLPLEGPRYERRQRIGRGGMGLVTVVWDRLLQREVALKEALDGTLLHEARLTARLDHPNIVPVYDATTNPEGRVTYTMRLLRGRPLDQVIAATPAGPERLRWLRAILAACEAVAYAHGSGIVHRDLKPANIVVGDLGETQVVDWGLARLAGDPVAGLAGTPGYSSPEQARGEPPTPTDDVWSLGRTLAELLGPQGVPELDAIIRRATAPIGERYPDARALSADLAGYIDGRPVAAYRYSPFEVLARLVRRHRLTFGVAGGVAIAGVIGVGGQWHQTVVERDRAVLAEADARRELATSLGGRAAQALRAGMLPEAEVLAIHALRRGRSPEAMGVMAALAAGARLTPAEIVALPPGCDDARLAGATVLCSGEDGVSAWAPGATSPRWRSKLHAGRIVASADRALVVDGEHRATLLRLGDGVETVAAISPTAGRFRAFHDRIVAFGAGGTWTWQDDHVTTAPSPCPAGQILQDLDGDVVVCDGGAVVTPSGVQHTPFTRPPAIPASVVVDGSTAWIGTFGGEVFAWDLDAERVLWSSQVGAGAVMTLRTLGDRVLAVGSRGARLLDPETGSPIAALEADAHPVEPLPATDALWTVGATLVRWSVPAEAPLREAVASVGLAGGAISPDGSRIALAGGDGHLSMWSVATGRRLGVQRDGVEPLKPPMFLADGTVALAGGATRSGIGLRRIGADGRTLPPIPPDSGIKRLVGLFDGSFIATNFGTSGPRRYDPQGVELPFPTRSGPLMVDLVVAPGRREALAVDEAGTLWAIGPDRLEAVGKANGAGAVALTGGTRAWARDREIQVGSRIIAHPWSGILDLAITPDGDRVVTGSIDGAARVLDVASGELIAVLSGHDERVSGVDVSPDGRWVLTTSWDQRARRWDLGVVDEPLPELPTLTLEAALRATAR